MRSPSFACSIRSAPAAASACRRPCPQPPPTCNQTPPSSATTSTRATMESTRKEVTPFACGSVCVGALELADELLEVEHLLLQHGGLVSRHGPLLQKEVLCRTATNHALATSADVQRNRQGWRFDGEGAVRCRTRSMNERRWRASRTLICRMMSLRQAGSGTGAPPEGGGERGADAAKLPLEVEDEPHPHQARAGASPCSAEELLVEVTSCCISIDLARSRFQSKPINVQIAGLSLSIQTESSKIFLRF